VYQLIDQFKGCGEYPVLRQSGRKPELIDERIEALILGTYRANNVSPTNLGKKIEETYGIQIQHKRIYTVFVDPRPGGDQYKKRQQRMYVQYERAHSLSM